MKFRVFLLVMLVVTCLAFNSFFSTVIDPTASANVAVLQIENSEAGAIATRSYTGFANVVPLVSWSVVGLLGALMFYAPIMTPE